MSAAAKEPAQAEVKCGGCSLVGPQLSDLRQRNPFKLGLARIDLALEHRSEVPCLMAADVHVVIIREAVVEAL